MDRIKQESEEISSLKISEWIKKTILTGVGAVFMTEEGIRNALSEMKMPKNVILSVVAQADRTKREISSIMAKEVRHFLDRIKVEDIIQKALAGQSIEIKATIQFVGSEKDKKIAAKKAAKNDRNGKG